MAHIGIDRAFSLAQPGAGRGIVAQFGQDAFEQALAYHSALNLRADITLGTTYDRNGQCSGFLAYDWAERYTGDPEAIWNDFFRPAVGNSASRISRGLAP